MKNVRKEKLDKLRQASRDVYTAIDWVEKNKANFKGVVYEPMFLMVGKNFKIKNLNLRKFK